MGQTHRRSNQDAESDERRTLQQVMRSLLEVEKALRQARTHYRENRTLMNESDLIIESFPPTGKGGQTASVVRQGVKVTHAPTGITATCDTERSQSRNKAVALAMVEHGVAIINKHTT